MKRYGGSRTDRQAIPPIPDVDVEIVLADFSARRSSPTMEDYFAGAAACFPATPRERDAALVAVRKAWVIALCRFNADQLHAIAFVMREEFRVRESMRMVDLSYRADISGGYHVL